MKTTNGVTTFRLQAEVYREGRSLGSFLTEPKDQLIIGAGKGSDLLVPSENTSLIHAMLRLTDDEKIIVYDLGSDSGTFVKGKRIVEHELTSGDFFEIAGHEIKVQLLRDEEISQVDPRQCLIWQEITSNYEHLEGISFSGNMVNESFTLSAGKFFQAMIPGGSIRVARQGKEFVECDLPAGAQAEIYDAKNQLGQVVESGGKISFHSGEKCRMKGENWELQLYWRAEGTRVGRSVEEKDQTLFRRSLAASLAVLLLAGLSTLLIPKEEVEMSEASYPKNTYFRMRTDAESQPEGASASGPAENTADNTPAQKPSAAQAITSSLAKILNKKTDAVSAESISQAVAQNGRVSTRLSNLPASNVQQSAISGGLEGAVNTKAISAGLKAGGGGGKGGSLNGFGKGVGSGVGAGFGGKGFSLNLGGEEAEAQGGLDKALIAAVVQANLGQIKHCYEKRLIIDPNLAGKIVAGWVIDKDGLVASTKLKSTTMNSNPVETCILGKIKTWKFPKPRGGGQVLVSYPFLFKPMN